MSITSPKQFVHELKKHGSIRATARAHGMRYGGGSPIRQLYFEAIDQGLIEPLDTSGMTREQAKDPAARVKKPKQRGRVKAIRTKKIAKPKKGKIKRFILTCAQSNTHVHEALWENLKAFAEHYDAKIMVSRFTYKKESFGRKSVKPGKASTYEDTKDLWYDDKIEPYIADSRVELAPGLIFCGEMNIMPTAVRPLSGLDSYTGRKSGVFPHVKIALESIATVKGEDAKINYTTGTVTLRNYIQKKAGMKAEFHHCFHPDTEFLTDKGLQTFRDTEGQTVKVWSGTAWEDAKIRSFGKQQLNEVELVPAVFHSCNGTNAYRSQNSKISHKIHVTPDHEWHLASGDSTQDLTVGDVIPASTVKPVNEGPEFEEGVRHGLIFGDGSVTYRSLKTRQFSHQICLHGEEAGKWAHLFSDIRSWPSREHIENYIGTAYVKSEFNFKELPKNGSSPGYLRGFFVGWIAADGHINKRDDCIQLCSVTKYALEWAVKTAPYAGFVATGFCKGAGGFTAFGKRRKKLWRLTLQDKPRYWKVKTIRPCTGAHEVMCAVVDPSHKFTLASGILTGNCFGGLLVEVDSDGDWFTYQLNADSEGTLYHMRTRAKGGVVEEGNFVDSIYWGDGHRVEQDPAMSELAFGKGGMKDVLRPEVDFIGDVPSNKARGHHDIRDPYKRFLRHLDGTEDAAQETWDAGDWIYKDIRWPWCTTYLVYGNHEQHLARWLKEEDARLDSVNFDFWSDMQSAVAKYLRRERHEPNYFQLALETLGHPVTQAENVKFLDLDDTKYKNETTRCPDANGGIENSMHGDRGPNGSRGTALGLSKMGKKANIGDKHSAQILDGVYVAGTFSDRDKTDWAHGPSSWSCSHIVTYENGKRAIYTFRKGKWRAQ